ncbi:MAG: hypothetical protein IKL10_01610 [Clostridia bacterium]|nr:hypothetical protein [Clostridia bacterium]
MTKVKKQKDYFDSVHIWGRLWSVGALIVLFSLPVAISVYYNAWPQANLVFNALLKLIPLYWATAIIEVITFTPMLGAGGAYLSFVTGNITNLKLPCALNAMEQAKVKSNSEEGEIISTIAVASSAITTTLIIAVGVIIFSPVLDEMRSSEALKPAFSYVSAALFGALGAGYLKKHWKISVFPVFVGIVVLLISPTFGVSTLLFVTIVAAVAGALVMSKLKIVK